jgi:hypothetical protein
MLFDLTGASEGRSQCQIDITSQRLLKNHKNAEGCSHWWQG